MESRSLYFLLGFLLMVNLVHGSPEFQRDIVESIGYYSEYCSDYASRYLIRFRRMRVQTVLDLWNFMENLYNNRSRDPWYEKSYFSLLYDFQRMYVDCIRSRDLGPGKR